MNKQDRNKSIHAFQDDALGTKDAVALVQDLRACNVSATELAQAARQRALRVEPSIHAITFNRHNHTRINHAPPSLSKLSHSRLTQTLLTQTQDKQAKNAMFFQGIPSYIKDNIAVKGLPTSYGSDAFKPKAETRHGAYTKQFLSTGVNVLGKSALPEFGFNASTEPAHTAPTCNPWHLDYSSGASSGGAAALVAAGVVPFAHGNDGGGSIRIPAACCGLVGLKPSRNRHINEFTTKTLPINIVSEGVLTRSVRDTAYFHFELQKHYRNTNLPLLPLVTSPNKQRLKIGLVTDSVTGFSSDTDTRESVLKTARLLEEAGHNVKEIKLPVSAQFAEDFGLYWGMLSFLVKKTAKQLFNRSFNPELLDPFSHGLANHYFKHIHKTPAFLFRLKQQAQVFKKQFEQLDVVLSPVLAQTTRPLGELHPNTPYDILFERLTRYASFTPIANVAGTPAISLPMGMSRDGLPIGIQLASNLGQEQILLELAYELEEAQPWQHLHNLVRH